MLDDCLILLEPLCRILQSTERLLDRVVVNVFNNVSLKHWRDDSCAMSGENTVPGIPVHQGPLEHLCAPH